MASPRSERLAPLAEAILVRSAPLLLPVLGVALLLVAVRALPGGADASIVLLLLLAAAVVGAMHRPAGLGLGAAAATLPVARALLGWGGAVVVAAAAAPLATLAQELGTNPERRTRRSRGRRALGELSLHALGAGGAMAAMLLRAAPPRAEIAAGAAWLALLVVLPLAEDRLARLGGVAVTPRAWRDTGGLLLDALGFAAGCLLVRAGSAAGWPCAGALLAALVLLAAEAARQRRLRHRADAGREALERIGEASERLVSAPAAIPELAVRVHEECRRVLPFSWFHLDVTAPGTAGGSWHATPDGRLGEGLPRPPSHPPPLPGVHRRVRWTVLERRLLSGGVELARLTLWCDPRRTSEEQLALFEQLMPQLAAHVHRAVLDRQAHQDPLTGVAVRRVLDARLLAAFERSREGAEPLAVALVDLDFFKRINDRFGHQAGDQALVAVAHVLRNNLRPGDLCARYGGEEFTLLLENATGAAALPVVERLRELVEELVVESAGERLPLSISAGVAAFPEVACRTADELLQLADEALYEAKRLGRNCCLLHAGRGRYVDGKGRTVETEEEPPTPRSPQIFA